jgi:hypothetical protein
MGEKSVPEASRSGRGRSHTPKSPQQKVVPVTIHADSWPVAGVPPFVTKQENKVRLRAGEANIPGTLSGGANPMVGRYHDVRLPDLHIEWALSTGGFETN